MKCFSNCKVLVAGAHYLCLYDNNNKIILHDKGGVYYGISWSREELFVLWRNHKKGEIILIFDSDFHLIDEIPLGKHLDGHQILYLENKLFVTNTAENGLIQIDTGNRKIKEIKLTPFNHDYNHINGLSYINDNHLWVLFANGKIEGKSEIKKYDIRREEMVDSLNIGDQIHNYLDDYITSSYDFEVFHYKDGKILNSVRLEGWLRGMDFIGDHLMVGSSVISERQQRSEKKDGKIYFLDKNFRILDQLKVPEIGQINEIRTISTSFSHNNIIFDGAPDSGK